MRTRFKVESLNCLFPFILQGGVLSMMSQTKETVTDLFATCTSGRVVSSEQKRIASGQGERIVCKDILKVSLTRSSYIFTRIVGIGQCNCSCAVHAKYWHGTVEVPPRNLTLCKIRSVAKNI